MTCSILKITVQYRSELHSHRNQVRMFLFFDSFIHVRNGTCLVGVLWATGKRAAGAATNVRSFAKFCYHPQSAASVRRLRQSALKFALASTRFAFYARN